MGKNSKTKLLLLSAVVIMIAMLLFIDYSVNYFKNEIYEFVYETHVDSVQSFSRDVNELISKEYVSKEDSRLYFNMINAYNKTLGGKYAIIAFLLAEDGKYYHSNDDNEAAISLLLENPDNRALIKQAAAYRRGGYINLSNNDAWQRYYYDVIMDGSEYYYQFMTVDKEQMQKKITANEVIIPLSVISLLLLFFIEYSLWLRSSYGKRANGVSHK